MPLTGKLFTSFISCKYKAHLQAMGETGEISAHERLLTDLDQNYLKESLRLYRDQLGSGQVRDNPESIVAAISEGYGLIPNSLATTGRLSVVFEALERVPSDTKVGASTQQYVPLVFAHREKVTGHDKLLATFYAVALAEVVGTLPTHAKIIHGHDCIATKVALVKATGMTEIGIKVRRLMDELATQIGGSSPPPFTLNNHCAQCEFRHRCHATAVEKDDISLLRGLSMGEVEQWRKRGVFTVTQLAYTFRAKSVTGKGAKAGRHLPPLQALAVRDKKIYLVHQPNLPEALVRVFLDVEGVPDRDFYYLVGIVVEEGGQTRTHSFWADGREAESCIWYDLLTLLFGLGNFTAYHYGKYDRTFLDHMISRYGVPPGSELLVERLKAETVDVLAIISGNIYFPVYSRSFKTVGTFVGAIWSDKSASGLQSLVWRHQWEETGDAALRQSLIRYNLEDCFALRLVIDFLRNLSRGSTGALEVVRSDELPSSTIHRFGMGRAATPEIGKIIKCAYFDYQMSKVFFRTNPAVRKSLRRKKIRWRSPKVNKVIECCAPKTCPHCRSEKVYVYQNSAVKKLVYDLRFTASGVRRWVVRYETKRYGCNSCAATTYSPDYPTYGSHLGDGLCSWVIHAHVALKQSFADISSGVNDSFGYSFADRLAYRIKLQAAKEYAPMLERLLAKLRASHVLYIDETKVLNGEKRGYVWAVTNLEEVVYLFNAARDGTVLDRVLNGFNGVLVSDFYSIYDAPACEQQKCVVHFVRDLNDDLKQHPLDVELAALARGFTGVFTPIIATIDRHGLAHHYLKKHKSDAEKYLTQISGCEYKSKVAISYQRRLGKYGARMFTLLSHDSVAWNNNAAENAIKLFAARRKVIGGGFSERGIGDYLLFLSIFCTLRRKGGSFLKFLRSGQKDIDAFLGGRRRRIEARPTGTPIGIQPLALPQNSLANAG